MRPSTIYHKTFNHICTMSQSYNYNTTYSSVYSTLHEATQSTVGNCGPTHSIGILHDQVLPRLQLETPLNNDPENAPGVVDVQGHLLGQLLRLELLHAEDHVLGGVLRVDPRDIAKLDEVCSSQHCSHGPFCHFEAVVSNLCGKNGSTLFVQLLSPLWSIGTLCLVCYVQQCIICTVQLLCVCVCACVCVRVCTYQIHNVHISCNIILTFGSHSLQALMLTKASPVVVCM